MIAIFVGSRGKGKTLSLVYTATLFLKAGWDIYSNMSLNFPHRKITRADILKITKDSPLSNCVLVLDEVQLYFDSRMFKDRSNILFSNFLQQLRKRNIIILSTTQYLNTVEKRFRQHIDVICLPNFNKDTGYAEIRFVDLTTAEDPPFDIIPSKYKILYKASDVFSLYNTHEIL
jgi:hypothetical protein